MTDFVFILCFGDKIFRLTVALFHFVYKNSTIRKKINFSDKINIIHNIDVIYIWNCLYVNFQVKYTYIRVYYIENSQTLSILYILLFDLKYKRKTMTTIQLSTIRYKCELLESNISCLTFCQWWVCCGRSCLKCFITMAVNKWVSREIFNILYCKSFHSTDFKLSSDMHILYYSFLLYCTAYEFKLNECFVEVSLKNYKTRAMIRGVNVIFLLFFL